MSGNVDVPPTLSVEELCVSFPGAVAAVRGVSFAVAAAECIGIVGESGSGKTQVCMAAMGLLAPAARATGSVRFEGREMLGADAASLNRVRGSKLTMVFQDPLTSLTPHLTLGVQMAETLVEHAHLSWREARAAAGRMLERVGIAEPARRLDAYPHELSGGMRQRVMIGMSLLCGPALLIADEPTTALDVTVQAQILELLRQLRAESKMAVVLISHDLGVVAGLAGRILVMYAGRIVESAAAGALLSHARHPYTHALLQCAPTLAGPRLERMPSLAGLAPNPADVEVGCAFAPRCPDVRERCRAERPLLRAPAGGAAGPRADPGAHPADPAAHGVALVACHFPRALAGEPAS